MGIVSRNNRTYESLKDNFNKVLPEQRMFFAKCLSNNQYISTIIGDVKISDIPIGKEISIHSFNIKSNTIENDIGIRIDSGLKSVYKITTESGKTVNATSDHTFFVYENGKIYEKTLSELNNSDTLIIK